MDVEFGANLRHAERSPYISSVLARAGGPGPLPPFLKRGHLRRSRAYSCAQNLLRHFSAVNKWEICVVCLTYPSGRIGIRGRTLNVQSAYFSSPPSDSGLNPDAQLDSIVGLRQYWYFPVSYLGLKAMREEQETNPHPPVPGARLTFNCDFPSFEARIASAWETGGTVAANTPRGPP